MDDLPVLLKVDHLFRIAKSVIAHVREFEKPFHSAPLLKEVGRSAVILYLLPSRRVSSAPRLGLVQSAALIFFAASGETHLVQMSGFPLKKCLAPSSPLAWLSVIQAISTSTVALLQDRCFRYSMTDGLTRAENVFETSVKTWSTGQAFGFGSGQLATVLQRFHSAASWGTPASSFTIGYLPSSAVGDQ